MKLLSYVANGESLFGVVSDDGVIAMNRRVGCKSLREALGAGLLPQIRAVAKGAAPDHKLSAITFLPVVPDPEQRKADPIPPRPPDRVRADG